MIDARIKKQIDAGDWRGAADVAVELEHLELAEELYLKLLDYESAGAVAAARGEPVEALEHYLQGGHVAAAEALRLEMLAELSAVIPDAIDLFARYGRHHAAAELASSVGQLARAAELFVEARSHLDAARHFERIGRWREAGEHYEAHLAAAPGSFGARLGLGRILQRFERHREACGALQGALALDLTHGDEPDDPELVEACERLAFSLVHLRLQEAAAVALGPGRRAALHAPEEFVRDFREVHGELGGGFSERYRVRGELLGPFPEAYEAHDTMSERVVMVQPLHGRNSARSAYLEAQSRLTRPPIPGVLEMVDADRDGLRFAVFEHPGGPTLASVLEREPPTGPQAGSLARQLVRTLEQAHRRGVLHGSLDPWAVYVRPGYGVAVAGFAVGQLGSRAETATAGGIDNPLSYLAPEVAFGGAADFRSDFYGIGAILWRIASGAPPSGRTPGQAPACVELFDALLAPDLEARPSSHARLLSMIDGVDWRVFPVAHGERRAPEASAEGTGREQLVETLAPGVTRVRDLWLGRDVVRIALRDARGGLPGHAERDRVRLLSRASLTALQRVLRFDATTGEIDLAWPGPSLRGVASSARLGPREAVAALLRVASTLSRLHGEGQPLGGFALEDVWIDQRDGTPTVRLSRSRLQLQASGGAAFAADLDALTALEHALLDDRTMSRLPAAPAGSGMRGHEERLRRLHDELLDRASRSAQVRGLSGVDGASLEALVGALDGAR